MRSVQPSPIYRTAGSREVAKLRRRGFTLVEVMISIAIALALIVGVSQIFGIAQQTTGAGTALSAINDQQRSVQTTLTNDIRAMVTNDQESPGLVIDSYAVPAFRSNVDQQNSPDPTDPTIFPGPFSGYQGQPMQQAYSVNDRIHRTDRMGFFVRGSYNRQTGEAPNLSSNTKGVEAFVWLGHLALPNDSTISNWDLRVPAGSGSGWFNPGATIGTTAASGKNDNNQFASSWILGRSVMLLSPDPLLANPSTPRTDSGFEFGTIPPIYLLPPTNSEYAKCYDGSGTNAVLCASRYDVVYSSIAFLNKYFAKNPNWWQGLTGLQVAGTTITVDQRYYANPFPNRPASLQPTDISNWISAAVALTHPIFVRGCSQFIVEFAGDYATQDPVTGVLGGPGGDGQIDFIVDPVTGNHRIRWYGFPRDTASSVNGALTPDGLVDSVGTTRFCDVVPVSTYLGTAPLGFERAVPTIDSANKMSFPNAAASNIPKSSQPYICAWGPDVGIAYPKMIRITIGIDNPSGRLNTQQLFEYVFTLPS